MDFVLKSPLFVQESAGKGLFFGKKERKYLAVSNRLYFFATNKYMFNS